MGDFDPNLSDHCPMTVKMLSRSVHNEHELALRPKPINIKWSKSVEEQFTASLSCTNFKGIIDNISATNEKICSGFGHDESGIASDINEIATNCSTNIRNAALDIRAVSKNVVLHKSKKKTKQDKPWHDDECTIQLRHVKSLGRLLNKSPWQRGLRHKVLFEKKQYNKLLRKKYRAFKAKLLNNLLDTSDKNPTEF